ncbi:MAG: NAD(P)-dependent oxidoreductase [Bacilli bacterium]
MKKVLVTGAAGAVGMQTIKYLLSEGKYEITALDLKNKTSIANLKRYRKRVNVILGDVTDRVLVEALVKEHDVIIHLAGVLPPLADMKKSLADIIDFKGTENIVRAISYYNPKCHLFYASSTSLYKDNMNATVKSTIKLDEFDYYNKAKKDAEELIIKKSKFYTIYRLPLILSNPVKEVFPFNGINDSFVDAITKEDAAYAFVKGIAFKDTLNKKIFNVTDGFNLTYKSLLNKVLEIYGFSWKYILNRMFLEKNFYSPVTKDNDELNKIINYRNDTLSDYLNRLRSRCKNRKLARLLIKPFLRSSKK